METSIPTYEFLALASAVIRTKGFVTRKLAMDELGLKATAETVIDSWLLSKGEEFPRTNEDAYMAELAYGFLDVVPKSDYERVAKEALQKDDVNLMDRQVTGILAAVIGIQYRQQEREKTEKALAERGLKLNEYFGTEGQRLTMELIVLTAPEKKTGQYGDYVACKLATDKGHWMSIYDANLAWVPNQKVTVKATIKRHYEDRSQNKWTALSKVRELTAEDIAKEAKKNAPKTPEQIERAVKTAATKARNKAKYDAELEKLIDQGYDSFDAKKLLSGGKYTACKQCDMICEDPENYHTCRRNEWDMEKPHFEGTAGHRYTRNSPNASVRRCDYCFRPDNYQPADMNKEESHAHV